MTDVAVRILHALPGPAAGPLERWLATERVLVADRQRRRFLRAGAASVRVVAGPPDDTPFGARLRALVTAERPAGLVVLGSGSVPLATASQRRALVSVAASGQRRALANNRFSADVIAIGCAERLLEVPDLPGDNALPRWLEEVAGYEVADLRRSWRLAIDLDGPIDLLLTGRAGTADRAGIDLTPVRARLAAVATAAADRRAELLVAGRTSAATLAWLERGVAARVRALVEERGLRAATRLAQARDGDRPVAARPPRSVLGMLLERDGPGAFGARLAELGDAAVVDSRVLLAHRFGADERGWPPAEDRFASDLLLADRVGDPWLRELTASAATAAIPVVLGGHTLVGPGLRLIGTRAWS
jgi:hypothetical protein